MLLLFFKLLVAHAVTDYALQSEHMATVKNRHSQRVVVFQIWYHWMTAHALINAGAVLVITGNYWCALAEFVLHWVIDFAKCDKWIGAQMDQWLHIACKVGYVVLWR